MGSIRRHIFLLAPVAAFLAASGGAFAQDAQKREELLFLGADTQSAPAIAYDIEVWADGGVELHWKSGKQRKKGKTKWQYTATEMKSLSAILAKPETAALQPEYGPAAADVGVRTYRLKIGTEHRTVVLYTWPGNVPPVLAELFAAARKLAKIDGAP